MLQWLENTELAIWVQESIWGYPIILSTHAIGMAIMAGIVLMINFRVLGLAPAIQLDALRGMYRVALLGLAINVTSGLILFVSNADAFFQSTPFWTKLSLLAVGVTLFIAMARRLFATGGFPSAAQTGWVKALSAVSCVVWLGVIAMGRLIAYWDWTDF